MSTKTWTVVKFDDENTVEAVPTSWILGSSCYWPPYARDTYARDKLVAAIKNFEAPNTHWPLHKMELFRNATFDSYLEARKKSIVAEYASDLNIDEEPSTRKNRHKRSKTVSSSSDDDRQYQPMRKRTPLLPKPPSRPIHDASTKENTPPINVTPMNESEADGTSNAGPDVCCCCPAHKLIVQTGAVVDLKQIKKQYLFMTNIMADIKSELTEIKSKVVTAQGHATPPLHQSFFTKFSLPVNDDGALEELEEYLGSAENFQKTVPEISNMGGNNIYDFAKRSLTILITNKFATKFSFLGKKQKAPFSKLKLCELVIKAAEQSRVSTTRKDTEDSIAK